MQAEQLSLKRRIEGAAAATAAAADVAAAAADEQANAAIAVQQAHERLAAAHRRSKARVTESCGSLSEQAGAAVEELEKELLLHQARLAAVRDGDAVAAAAAFSDARSVRFRPVSCAPVYCDHILSLQDVPLFRCVRACATGRRLR